MKKRLMLISLLILTVMVGIFTACKNDKCRYKQVVENATCDRDGYTAMVCEDCGKEQKGSRNVIPAKGHTLVSVEKEKPSCEKDGHTAYENCTVCGYKKNYATIKATHEYEYIEAKAPTCDRSGYSAYKKCKLCGLEANKTEIKARHEFIDVMEKAVTCCTDGYSAHKKCSVCGVEDGKVVIKATHSFVSFDGKEATCTEAGYTAYKKCSKCGLEEGKTSLYKQHDYVYVEGKTATCDSDGYTDYEKCSVCGEISGREIIRAHHTFVKIESKAATCTENGYSEYEKCSGCGAERNKTIIIGGHEFIAFTAKKPTCHEDGYTAHETCTICGFEKGKTVIKARHEFVRQPSKTATCQQPGNSEYEKCALCGEERYKQLYTVPHSYKTIPGKEATCLEDGYSSYFKCSVCGTESGKTIVKAKHVFVRKLGKEATCYEDGYSDYLKCNNCNLISGYRVIKAGHKFIAVTAKDATCTEDGYSAHERCFVCGFEKDKTVIKGGHEMIKCEAKAASCTENGYTAHEMCVKCGLTVGKTVIKASHDYVYVPAKSATCLQPGYNRHMRCTKCGLTKDKKEITVEHSFVNVSGKQPTCLNDGYSDYKKCSVCGAESGKKTIAALGHAYGEFTDCEKATCVKNGTQKAVCHRCNYEYIREIENSKQPHEYVKKSALDENGLKSYVCDGCGDKQLREATKVVILSGQSNAVGYSVSKYLKNAGSSVFAEKYAEYKNGFDNVYIRYNNNEGAQDAYKHNTSGNNFVNVRLGQGVGLQSETVYPDGAFGPEIGIAEKWNKSYPENPLYIIKYAYGGTSIFNEWCSPSAAARENTNIGVQYTKMAAYVKESIKILEKSGLAPEIQAFVWMQGESDAYHYYTYYNRYDSFVGDVREEMAAYSTQKGLAFIDGGISAHWANYRIINDVKKEYSLTTNRNYFIDTVAAGLTYDKDNTDYSHFDSVPMLKLGDMFGSAVIECVENESVLVRNKSVSDGITASSALDGDGSLANPYILANADDWLYFAKQIDSGNDYAGKYVRVTSDVYLTHPSFDPIGMGEFNYNEQGVENNGAFFANGEEKLFAGELDGNGKTVNVRFYRNERAVALFRGIAPGGAIKNLNVSGDIYVTDGQKWIASAIVAYNSGRIENCNNYANVTAFSRQAGIAARNVGTITGCKNYGTIFCNSNDCRVGGIVGEATKGTKIVDCENYGSVGGKQYVGGIVGVNKCGEITGCKNEGNVKGNRYVAGICSYMTEGKMSLCENDGDVECSGALPSKNTDHQCIAGVCAYAESGSTIDKCVNRGAVFGEKMLFIAGGIAAHIKATTVTDCDNFGDIISADDNLNNTMRGYIAGVVGWGESNSNITDCTNLGAIQNVFFRSGGVIGYLNGGTCDGLVNGSEKNTEAGMIVFSSLTVNCCRNGGLVGELKNSTLGNPDGVAINNRVYGKIVNAHMWNGGAVGVADNSSVYFTECHAEFTCKNGTYDLGGIVGHVLNKLTVKNCVNYSNIGAKYNVGGIVGGAIASTEIADCENYGKITSTDAGKCSGISGSKLGTIIGCVDHAQK